MCQENKNCFEIFLGWLTKYNVALTVLATVGLFLFAVISSRQTSQIINQAKKEESIRLRSYLYSLGQQFLPVAEQNPNRPYIVLSVNVKNAGQTPASDFWSEGYVFLNDKMTINHHDNDITTSHVSLGPGQDINTSFGFDFIDLKKLKLDASSTDSIGYRLHYKIYTGECFVDDIRLFPPNIKFLDSVIGIRFQDTIPSDCNE